MRISNPITVYSNGLNSLEGMCNAGNAFNFSIKVTCIFQYHIKNLKYCLLVVLCGCETRRENLGS